MGKKREADWRRVLQRFANFLRIFSLVIFSIYVAGNFRDFLDSTQILLLKILARISCSLFLLSFFLFAEQIFSKIKKKADFATLTFIFNIVFAIIGAILTIFSSTILFLSAGI